jgi:hypothetical protein
LIQSSEARLIASQNKSEEDAVGGPSNLTAFIQSFEDVEGCGLAACTYTANFAWKAKLNTKTHAKSSKTRQNAGFRGLSGEVSGGISM